MVTDFLEYPLLLIQQITVLTLFFRIHKTFSNAGICVFFCVYLVIVYSWLQSPAWFLQILIVSTIQNSFADKGVASQSVFAHTLFRGLTEHLAGGRRVML